MTFQLPRFPTILKSISKDNLGIWHGTCTFSFLFQAISVITRFFPSVLQIGWLHWSVFSFCTLKIHETFCCGFYFVLQAPITIVIVKYWHFSRKWPPFPPSSLLSWRIWAMKLDPLKDKGILCVAHLSCIFPNCCKKVCDIICWLKFLSCLVQQLFSIK